MKPEIKFDSNLGRWLGLVITDGTLNKWTVRFGNINEILLEDFQNLTSTVFGLRGNRTHSNGKVFVIQINSTELVNLVSKEFEIPIGNKSKIITVPTKIMSSNDSKVVCSFLQGVFDGDGSAVFNKNHWIRRVDLTSGSIKFLEQIKSLLTNLGIASRLSKTETRLLITRKDDITLFQNIIGFKHPTKRHKTLQMIN